MERINVKDLTNLDYDFIKCGTSAIFMALNPHNNRYGILKENGRMIGVENEDLREKLASTILNICGVACAEVDLCMDNNNKHYALSYSILGENQGHVELEYSGNLVDSEDKELVFNEYFKNVFASIIVLPGITMTDYHAIRKRILEIYFMNIIVGNYDDKSDNMKIIYDGDTKMYLPPIAYDYGIAFSPDSLNNNGIFHRLMPNEVMFYLIKNYHAELKELIDRIKNNLTLERIIEILSDEEYEPLGQMQTYNYIKFKLIMMNNTISSVQKRATYDKSLKTI